MSNPYAPPDGGRPAAGPAGPPPDGAAHGPEHGSSARVGAGPRDASGPQDGAGPHDGSAPHHQPPTASAPPPRTPRPAPDPEAVRAASRRVLNFGLLMMASLVTASLTLPWQAAGLLFAIAATVTGVRALISVWRAGLRGALVAVLTTGLVFAAVLCASFATMIALWPVEVEHQQCLQGALTISARETCEQQFQDAVTERLERATRPQG